MSRLWRNYPLRVVSNYSLVNLSSKLVRHHTEFWVFTLGYNPLCSNQLAQLRSGYRLVKRKVNLASSHFCLHSRPVDTDSESKSARSFFRQVRRTFCSNFFLLYSTICLSEVCISSLCVYFRTLFHSTFA